MCIGGGSSPPPQQVAPPPPPPPMDSPANPAYTEQATAASNADVALASGRRGRKSLRVNTNTQTGQSQAAQPYGGSVTTGLNVT